MNKTSLKTLFAIVALSFSTVSLASQWTAGYSNGEDYVVATDVTNKVKFVLSCDGFSSSNAALVGAKNNKQLAYNYRLPGTKPMVALIDGVVYVDPFSKEVYNTPQKYAAFYTAFRDAHDVAVAVNGATYKFNTEGLKQALPAVGSADFKCELQ